MKQSISSNQFHDAFMSIRPDNFSYEGLNALHSMLESYEEDTGEEIELDVIAICCDYTEYTFDEAKEQYSNIDGVSEAEDMSELMEAFSDHTQIIHVNDGQIILAAF